MTIAGVLAGLTPGIQILARPYAIYAVATAIAVALWRNPTPDMLAWAVAGLGALVGARTADKIWGRALVPPIDGGSS